MEKYIAPDRKRIPYGMMNFAVIRRDDCYYVDKTRFIPMIEEADKLAEFGTHVVVDHDGVVCR